MPKPYISLYIHPLTCIHTQTDRAQTHSNYSLYLFVFTNVLIQEDEIRQITWNGQGDAISKAISCAEIMKKKIKVKLSSGFM